MSAHVLSRWGWAPPQYLLMPAFGVDISRGSIKFVSVGAYRTELRPKKFGEVALEPGVFAEGEIEKPDVIRGHLKSLRTHHGLKFAHASLSEKKAFIYQTAIPNSTKDIKSAVEYELEAHVPLPPQETVFDYELVRRGGATSVYAVTAYAKRVVEMYETVFREAGVTLSSLEVEAHAVARAVLPKNKRDAVTLVVDMGSHTTRITVVDGSAVSYTATMDFGTEVLLDSIMRHLGITREEALVVKDTRGFLLGEHNRNVIEAVINPISVFRDELKRHIEYWNHAPADDIPRPPITSVVLSGGNANMRGLVEYISDNTGLIVEPANVWRNLFSLDTYVPPMLKAESLEFSTAVGLAIKK